MKLMDEAEVQKRLDKLDARESMRLGQIMLATGEMVGSIIRTAGPDDGRIALVCAIAAVYGAQAWPGSKELATAKMAEITMDFAIEALLARRKKR